VVSTYTISGLYVGSGGIAAGTMITISTPSGTVLPDYGTYYTLTDTTTPSGSGTVSSSGITDYTGNQDLFTVPNGLNAGDLITLTIGDVLNPGAPSSTYTITFTGNLNGPSAIAPFPQANATYPNGSLINFSGTIYLFAGGHAFGIPTPTVLQKIQAVDKAVVLKAATGAVVPTRAVRPGTLVTTNAVNSNATIYVMGTDSDFHGFSTTAQFTGDGYDPALVVTVPSLGNVATGSTAGVAGSAVSALATTADGAIVDSSSTYYVFDGGKAFGIPTPAALSSIRKTDKATSLTGTVTSAMTGAAITSGVLYTVNGIVYVSFVGNLEPFKAPSQLTADGYGGTASVPGWNLGGLSVVTSYTGS